MEKRVARGKGVMQFDAITFPPILSFPLFPRLRDSTRAWKPGARLDWTRLEVWRRETAKERIGNGRTESLSDFSRSFSIILLSRMVRKKRIKVCRWDTRDAWRETCLSQRLSRRRVSINCSSDHIMCRLVARSWICCTSCRSAWIGERKRERENGRGMFLQRVSRMSHERVTRDLWKLENRARSWSIGIRFRLGYIYFSFFPIFPSFLYDFLEEESEPRKGSINSSRSNVAIFRFIETTHSPFKKRFTYAPMGCSRHQVARGKYQLRVMKPRFSAERYTYYIYVFIACIVAHSIECCAITYTYPPFWLIFPGSWINL